MYFFTIILNKYVFFLSLVVLLNDNSDVGNIFSVLEFSIWMTLARGHFVCDAIEPLKNRLCLALVGYC